MSTPAWLVALFGLSYSHPCLSTRVAGTQMTVKHTRCNTDTVIRTFLIIIVVMIVILDNNNNTVQCCMTFRWLAYWYCNLQLLVCWQNVVSDPFLMSNGVRQGGILSPFLFRFYIRDLITKLTNTGLGCNIRGAIINVLCYADDMVLLAPSWAALQKLLNVLEAESLCINMSFNTKKTVCVVFNPTSRHCM